jgi:hypothetical protein
MMTSQMLDQLEERFIEECRATFHLFKKEILEQQKEEKQ